MLHWEKFNMGIYAAHLCCPFLCKHGLRYSSMRFLFCCVLIHVNGFLDCFCFAFFLMIFLFSWLFRNVFKSHTFFYYSFMCMWCPHLCVYRCIYPCMCGRQRRPSGVLPYHSPSESLTETWSKAGSQQAPEILLPLRPQHWGYKSLCAQSHSAFYMGATDLNLGFQSCAASVLIHWARSSTSLFISSVPLEDA